jgi:hypothetical protein
MIEDAINGMDGTVPVTSRRAYSFPGSKRETEGDEEHRGIAKEAE